MTMVSVGGTEISIKPLRLLDYVEKLDFIKMRRMNPWDLIQGFPLTVTNDETNYKILVAIAMRTVYTNSSSVSQQEEALFSESDEGTAWLVWKCLPKQKSPGKGKQPDESWQQGINRAKRLWESATEEERSKIRLALFATDESNNLKNSDGQNDAASPLPPEPEKQSPST